MARIWIVEVLTHAMADSKKIFSSSIARPAVQAGTFACRDLSVSVLSSSARPCRLLEDLRLLRSDGIVFLSER